MLEQINELLNRIKLSNNLARKEAIFELAMILEKNAVPGQSWSETDFVPPIPVILLNIKQQQEVVDKLVDIIKSGIQDPSIYWALGKAPVKLGLRPFLNLIQQYGLSFDDETRWQILRALDLYLTGPIYAPEDWRRKELASFPNMLSLIENWIKTSTDDRIGDVIKRLRAKILKLIE